MKNLKKVLSLALAFAMVLGLCIGASAAQDVTTLTDWNEVENKDAATLLNAFNIMQGNDDGTFAPNDNVTRAQAAKMISVALWGGSDDVALYNASNIGGYTDVVAGSWYMGYVNYMTAVKVMAGKGEGIFDPNGNVTGYELLKMCLIGLGYNPETEGLVGAGWDIKTMSLATRPGFQNLTADTTVTNWNAPLSRMNAATIISNMIKRTTVYYDLSSGVGGNVVSQVKPTVSGGKEVSFAESYLKMTVDTGILIANEYGSIDTVADPIVKTARNYKDENAIVVFEGTDDDDNPIDVPKKMKLTSDFDQLGNQVKAYYTNNGKTFVYAAVVEAAEVEPTFTRTTGALNNDDTDGVTLYVNGAEVESVTAANLAEKLVAANVGTQNTAKTALNVAYNAEVSYRDTDGDGYIDQVIAYTLGDAVKVTAVATSEKYGTVLMTGNVSWNEKRFEAATENAVQQNAIIESLRDFDAEKGEYIMTAAHAEDDMVNCFGQQFNHGVTLETIEGKVTRKTSNNETIYLDGTKYANEAKENNALVSLTVGDEGKFYVLNDTIVVTDLKSKANSSTYALIYDAGYDTVGTDTTIGGSAKTVYEVAAALPDGTSKVFEVDTFYIDGEKVTKNLTTDTDDGFGSGGTLASVKNAAADNGTTDILMAYTLTNDGKINLFLDKVAVTTAGDDKNASVIDAKTKVTAGNAKVGNLLLTGTSVTYIRTSEKSATTEEKWVAYTGTSAPTYTIEANGAVAMHNASNNISYMAVSETTATDNTVDGIFYLLTDPVEIDDKGTLEVEAFSSVEGKPVTLQYTVGTTPADTYVAGEAGDIYQAWSSTTGFSSELEASALSGTTTVTGNAGFITRADSNVLVLSMKTTADDASTTNQDETVVTNKVLGTNSDTVVVAIAGEDTETIALNEIALETIDSVAAGDLKGYQAIVIEGTGENAGNAAIVVILENAAKLD